MIRQLLLAAIEEGARVFDLGTGDQPFKVQLATEVNRVRVSVHRPSPGNAKSARRSSLR